MNAIQGLNDVMRALEDIRRLHRLAAAAWPVLPDRYTSLKRDLIAIKQRTPTLTDDQRSNIQGAIQQLSNIERRVENAMAGGADVPSVNRINNIISKQIDRLAVLLVDLQNEIDRTRQ